MEKLNAYLEANSAIALADEIGVHKTQVYRWKKGQSRPDLVQAFRLEDATGGAVPARAWVE